MPRDRNEKYHPAGEDDNGPVSPPLSTRGADSRSEQFSQPTRYSRLPDSRRSSLSPRPSFDSREDPSSSTRGRQEGKAWRSGEERNAVSPSKDTYRRGGREDNVGRDRDPWDNRSNAQNPSSGRRWGLGYNQHAKSSQQEPPWGSRNDDKEANFSRWTPKDNRANLPNDSARNGQGSNSRNNDAWSRDDRKSSNPSEWRSDNGWASRRRPSDVEDPSRPRHPDPPDAPASNPAVASRNNGLGGVGKKKNKGKNKKNNKQQRRDWRNDDGQLNNWQKRDSGYSNATNRPIRKPQHHTSSRSRSRSPAGSYYSRRSSRGRSPRSPYSDTPKRRRSYSRSPTRSLTPSDRRGTWSGRPYGRSSTVSRSPSRSPRRRLTPRSPGRSRSPLSPQRGRRSLSVSTGSRSRSRSRTISRSPKDRSRTVHRLPTATSLEEMRTFSMPKPANQPSNTQQRPETNAEGTQRPPNQRERKRNRKKGGRSDNSNIILQNAMPPPSLPAAAQAGRPSVPVPNTELASFQSEMNPTPSWPEHRRNAQGPPQMTFPKANTGFRPIAQTNKALKRFFSADDDEDVEGPSKRNSSAASVARVATSTSMTSTHFATTTEGVPNQNGAYTQVRAQTHVVQERWNAPHTQPMYQQQQRSSPMLLSPTQNSHHPPPSYDGSRVPSDYGQHFDYRQPPSQSQPPPPPPPPPHFQEHLQAQSTPAGTRPPSPIRGSNQELYSIVNQVGEGTFGKVYKARNINNGRFVALKRIRMETERDGFPVTAMREIKLLQSLSHDNVVRLYEMMVSNGSVYMVFEYMDHDLTGVLSQTQFSFTDAHLKSLCRQMLAGLAYLHHKGVIHRDMKGSNILINNRGELKLADFGLARFYQKRRRSDYTNRVITLWYRPPELLFGTTVYGPEVDMWSAGCIMLELFTKKPIFQGNDEIHQLDVIYKVLGTPTAERWSGVTSLPWYELVKPKEVIPNHFRELFQKWLSPAALDLAESLLAYDPAQRASAAQALEAPYFSQEQPPPEAPTGLCTLEGEWHELETKRERAKKRRKTEGSAQEVH